MALKAAKGVAAAAVAGGAEGGHSFADGVYSTKRGVAQTDAKGVAAAAGGGGASDEFCTPLAAVHVLGLGLGSK